MLQAKRFVVLKKKISRGKEDRGFQGKTGSKNQNQVKMLGEREAYKNMTIISW